MIPTAAPTCDPNVIALNAPTRAPTTIRPGDGRQAAVPGSDDQGGHADPEHETDERADEQAGDQRPNARLDGQAGRLTDVRVQADSGRSRPSAPPTARATTTATRNQRTTRLPGTPTASSARPRPRSRPPAGARGGPPSPWIRAAIRPGTGRPPMTSKQAGEQDHGDRQRGQGDDPPDLAGDLADLGPGQLEVGPDERDRRVAGGADLGTQAGWRLASAAVRRALLWRDAGWVVQGSGSDWGAPGRARGRPG